MECLVKGVGREEFLARLAADFPKAAAGIRSDEAGLLHCEVAAFRRATETAMDSGELWGNQGAGNIEGGRQIPGFLQARRQVSASANHRMKLTGPPFRFLAT